MKCKKCGGKAVLELRRHNAAFCADDFLGFFRSQTLETIRRWKMFGRDEPLLVAVSGGKDSLGLWDVLLDAGYRATGLYLDLGIGDYSRTSRARCEAFAAERSARLLVVRVADAVGAAIPDVRVATRRPTCSACGLSKRYLMNRAALEQGFPVVVTGHNLDDEAATLFGSTLRWEETALARQAPVLEATHPRLVRRVKPLFRLSERETAAYAFLRGIDYVVEECPLVAGNTQLRYKEAMNAIESRSPGTKAQFFLGYLDRARPLFHGDEPPRLRSCESCGQPTTGRFCAFCRARAQILGQRLDGRERDDETAAEMADEVLPVEIYGEPVLPVEAR
jgi:tRNA-5-methyluridine54 2-sulfurtransferase